MESNAITTCNGFINIAANLLGLYDKGSDISGIKNIPIISLDKEAWN